MGRAPATTPASVDRPCAEPQAARPGGLLDHRAEGASTRLFHLLWLYVAVAG